MIVAHLRSARFVGFFANLAAASLSNSAAAFSIEEVRVLPEAPITSNNEVTLLAGIVTPNNAFLFQPTERKNVKPRRKEYYDDDPIPC